MQILGSQRPGSICGIGRTARGVGMIRQWLLPCESRIICDGTTQKPADERPSGIQENRVTRKAVVLNDVGLPPTISAISLPVVGASVRPKCAWPKAKKTLAKRGERSMIGSPSGSDGRQPIHSLAPS